MYSCLYKLSNYSPSSRHISYGKMRSRYSIIASSNSIVYVFYYWHYRLQIYVECREIHGQTHDIVLYLACRYRDFGLHRFLIASVQLFRSIRSPKHAFHKTVGTWFFLIQTYVIQKTELKTERKFCSFPFPRRLGFRLISSSRLGCDNRRPNFTNE